MIDALDDVGVVSMWMLTTAMGGVGVQPFADIVGLTDVAEGSIVRTIVRLDETCKEIRNAARIIGDSRLYVKMEEASRLIKRDIVFAASLYYDR